MELDTARLRVLVEVAHSGSIAAAARRLSFTPSALSQQLSKLEQELGAQLLHRRSTGVTPTAVGAVLVEHGERVLGELRQAQAAVDAALGGGPQRLAVGTFATAGQVLVPSALAALRERYPSAELSLLDIEPPGGYGLVTSGDLDLLITHRYPGVPSAPTAGLSRRPLFADALRLVLPEGQRFAARAAVRLSELAEETWISGADGVPNRTCLESLFRAAALAPPRVAYETADYHVILALVAAGLGAALVPASVLAGAGAPTARVTVHRLRGASPHREVCVVHHRQPAELVREFVALLRAAAP